MEHSAHPTKRPRLTTPASWSSKLHGQGVSLPQPNPPHHPPAPGGPHHPLPPAQYTPAPPFSRPSEPPLPPAPHHQPLDERRHHHEHEHYPPMQDTPRQLPLSPAHPSYPSYPPRDPIVKRDIGEEPALPQLRRPSSTGHTVDGLPPAPHGPPHPNQHHPSEDPRRHMNFDNGASMPHSPALYRPPALPQAYHPPTSQQPPQHYDGPHNYGHPPQVYAALEIQNASAKRKPQRASQACDNCRQLKAKCDETKPCKNCREKNVECKYRDPPAKQPDKATTDILEILSFLKEEMSSMSAKFDKFDKMESRVCNLENMAIHSNPEAAKMKMESIEEDDQPNLHQSSMSDNGDMPEAEEEATGTSTPGRTSVLEPSLSLNEAHETLRQGDCDDVEAEPGPMVLPGRPAMPPNHTTLASLLLKWPSINKMLNHILLAEQIQYVEEYPIREEQRRGVLRLFGRGEGPDSDNRTSDKGTPQDLSTTDGEDASDVIAPTPGPELWGQVGSPAPGPGIDYKGGVLTADGNPDWDQTRILKYVRSFKDNILNMHPILIPKELDAMVRVFLDQLPKSSTTPSSNKASSFPGGTVGFIHQPAEVGAKRKRSPVADEPSPVMSFRKPGRPFRNIQSALVLLVFALGKICLHKGKIPDVVHEPDGFTSNSPLVRNGVLASPSQGSPGLIPPSSSGLPSPKENERAVLMSRRSSLQGGNNIPFSRASSTHKRNLDVIPGLEYFALASDIMGADYGGFCLKHVYVHILAGLYHGQLGRVLESWEHISTASRKLQVVLRPSLGRLSKLGSCTPHSRRDNQLAFAFWTCLQLESDILAELQLPQSGILAYESQMPYPNTEFAHAHGFPPYVTEGYLAQLYLRKQLNKVHNLLYDPTTVNSHHYQTMENEIDEIQRLLKSARNTWVPPDYRWKDDDPLPDDILAARLRAKYWGSQVILYRPFLRMILDGEAQPPPTYQNDHASPDAITPMGLNEKSRKVHDPRTIENARLAIDALIESTRAFHGIHKDKRIIITNVFGTAHAQWGNLLTLAACYKDRTLCNYINVDTLSGLFSRTIAFFKEIAQPSSALHKDMNILISLAAELGFPHEEMDIRADSSFSSTTSSALPPPIFSSANFYRGPSSPAMMRQH
ncbi:hypothetical protein ANO14919_093340 [Xylariales sp. No.14919]|nr:hypothetical protein F5X98DRAFT_273085 [Xylaria grammica]GAW19843.1 hypothetical protein ANO14919_093340 [Xylariales sp. No.14919]